VDDSPSHPSGFPATTSTYIPVLRPSDHHHIASHVSMTAHTRVAKGPSRPVNIATWHSLIPAMTISPFLLAAFQTPEERLMGVSRTSSIAS